MTWMLPVLLLCCHLQAHAERFLGQRPPPGTQKHFVGITNGWHAGRIEQDGPHLRWINEAKVSWRLHQRTGDDLLLTDASNPYQAGGRRDFRVMRENGMVIGFDFGGERYLRKTPSADVRGSYERAGLSMAKYIHLRRFDMHVLGTAGVSDWMMNKTAEMADRIVGALSDPAHRARFAGHSFYVITDADPDLQQLSGGRRGQRNTGNARYTLVNESLVCRTAVDTLAPNEPPIHRRLDTPVHELGHSIEERLGLARQVDQAFASRPGYDPRLAREYFSFALQHRFDSAGAQGTSGIAAHERAFMATLFDPSDRYIPDCSR